MTNYGNTGQRYKMPKRESATVHPDGSVTFHLSCGHDQTHGYGFYPWTEERAAEFIGARTRCDQCRVK